MSDAAILAAKKYLQGAGPWKLDKIGIGADDYLVRCFAEAMEHERAAVVTWLRGLHWTHHLRPAAEKLADAIERGDHTEAPA